MRSASSIAGSFAWSKKQWWAASFFICAAAASAISRRPWPTETNHRPADASRYSRPAESQTRAPSPRETTNSLPSIAPIAAKPCQRRVMPRKVQLPAHRREAAGRSEASAFGRRLRFFCGTDGRDGGGAARARAPPPPSCRTAAAARDHAGDGRRDEREMSRCRPAASRSRRRWRRRAGARQRDHPGRRTWPATASACRASGSSSRSRARRPSSPASSRSGSRSRRRARAGTPPTSAPRRPARRSRSDSRRPRVWTMRQPPT